MKIEINDTSWARRTRSGDAINDTPDTRHPSRDLSRSLPNGKSRNIPAQVGDPVQHAHSQTQPGGVGVGFKRQEHSLPQVFVG